MANFPAQGLFIYDVQNKEGGGGLDFGHNNNLHGKLYWREREEMDRDGVKHFKNLVRLK